MYLLFECIKQILFSILNFINYQTWSKISAEHENVL